MKSKPEDILEITINGENRRLLMSYATLRAAIKALGGMEDATVLMMSPDLQEDVGLVVLQRLIPEKKDAANFDEFTMSVADGEKLARWITEHVLDFFIRGLMATNEMSEQIQKLAGTSPASSPNGSPDSPK